MCGIYGGMATGEAPLQHCQILEEMGRLLRHRGPDSHDIRMSDRAAIGAERLRIHDLTPAGDQPFADPSGDVWAAVNGAIYNAPDIRARYSDFPYKSRSDAEVVVPLYLDKGPACISELEGMFAIAVYDSREQTLTLARDRAGEKPLFYCQLGGEVWFASEVQALLSLPQQSRDLDMAAVRDFVTMGYVTQPKTMFEAIKKVRAGAYMTFSPTGCAEREYWDPTSIASTSATSSELVNRLESLLLTAIEKQLTAEVPVGIFTSGGVDSSMIAAMACHFGNPHEVSTFSVGFTERQFDETRHAERLASHLGTRHRCVSANRASLDEALRVVVDRVAEPSADPAILPTFLLSRAASESVKVVLAGEGADELFGGYPTYLGHQIVPYYLGLPTVAQRLLRRMALLAPVSLESKVSLEYLVRRFLDATALPLAARHLAWFGTGAGPSILNPDILRMEYEVVPFPEAAEEITAACTFDYRTYLRENLLTKVDRATMLASIEARAPYLDSGVSSFALALRSCHRVRRITTKWLLKRVALRWLPRRLVTRRKRGLSVPVAAWLNRELGHDVDRLLNRKRLERQGLLHSANVDQLLKEHRRGHANHGRALWALLMLEFWLERWVPEIS